MSKQKTDRAIWPENINPLFIERVVDGPQNLVMWAGFRANKTYTMVFHLWVEYYVLTETFDRGLPGYMFHGDWVPFDLNASNDYAHQLRMKITLLTVGKNMDAVQSAQREARDIPFPKLKEIYDRLGTFYLSTPG